MAVKHRWSLNSGSFKDRLDCTYSLQEATHRALDDLHSLPIQSMVFVVIVAQTAHILAATTWRLKMATHKSEINFFQSHKYRKFYFWFLCKKLVVATTEADEAVASSVFVQIMGIPLKNRRLGSFWSFLVTSPRLILMSGCGHELFITVNTLPLVIPESSSSA